MFGALNSMARMRNFASQHQRFLHRRVSKEAKAAAKEMREGNASILTREALAKFSFSQYYEDIMVKAPLLTTTMVAASTKTKFPDLKVIQHFCKTVSTLL